MSYAGMHDFFAAMAARATRSASGAASSSDDASRCLLLALSHDELGVIVDGLADPLQPVVAVALSSTCLGLRTPLLAVPTTQSDGRRLIWPGKQRAGFVDALLNDPEALRMICGTAKDQADPTASVSAAPDSLHDKDRAAIRRMQANPRDTALAMMKKLSKLDQKTAELLEIRAADVEPTQPDAIKLRWLWTRCMNACGCVAHQETKGRFGQCDARHLHGCGRTHAPTVQRGDTSAINWYQDDKCGTWCAIASTLVAFDATTL